MTDPQPSHPLTLEEAFGRVIRGLREKRGLTQVDVAVETGFSQRAIGMIERGEKSPTLRTMDVFASLYDVALEKLIVKAKVIRDASRS